MAQEEPLKFWDEDLALFYHIPNHRIISFEEAINREGISIATIQACRTWWNTNLVMDNFLPILAPCCAEMHPEKTIENVCLDNFARRLKQRAVGMEQPQSDFVQIKHGLIILQNTKAVAVVYNKNLHFSIARNEFITSENEDNLILIDFRDNNCGVIDLEDQVIKRLDGYTYWDSIARKVM